jgi:hypothetical protein
MSRERPRESSHGVRLVRKLEVGARGARAEASRAPGSDLNRRNASFGTGRGLRSALRKRFR